MDEAKVNKLLDRSKQKIGAIEYRTKRNLFIVYGIGATAAIASGFIANDAISLVGFASACVVTANGAYYARESAEDKRSKEFYEYAAALTGNKQYTSDLDLQDDVDDIISDLELDEIDKNSSYSLVSIVMSAMLIALVIDNKALLEPMGIACIAGGLTLARYSIKSLGIIIREESTETLAAVNSLDYLTEQRYRLAG